MATFEKRGSRWRARIRVRGVDMSETFTTKKDAQAWVSQMESEQTASRLGRVPPGKTFADLLHRYLQSEVPSKRSAVAESNRIRRILRDEPKLVQQQLAEIGPEHFSAWRDRRSRQVSAAAGAYRGWG